MADEWGILIEGILVGPFKKCSDAEETLMKIGNVIGQGGTYYSLTTEEDSFLLQVVPYHHESVSPDEFLRRFKKG